MTAARGDRGRVARRRVALVVALALAAALTDACSPAGTGGAATPVPTSSWVPGQDAMAALLSGTLGRDPSGCLTVDGFALVWPAGYGAVDAAGAVVVLNADGVEAARTGTEVSVGGGQAPGPVVDGPCAGKPAWLVQVELP